MEVDERNSRRVFCLNMGGTIFYAHENTLRKSGYFKHLLLKNLAENEDKKLTCFIDRDPLSFAYILDFLRGYPMDDVPSNLRSKVEADFDFFQIPKPQQFLTSEKENEPVVRLRFAFTYSANRENREVFSKLYALSKMDLEKCKHSQLSQMIHDAKSKNSIITLSGFHYNLNTALSDFVIDVLKFGKCAVYFHFADDVDFYCKQRFECFDFAKELGLKEVIEAIGERTVQLSGIVKRLQ